MVWEVLESVGSFIPAIRTLVIVAIAFVIMDIILKIVKKRMLNLAKTKKQRSNVEIFTKIVKYGLFVLILVFAIFSYAGSWTGLGLSMGLFSASLGWALQKPISGMAAWVMMVTRRPFEIGDRVIVGDFRGDVTDITITHIYLEEIGGIVAGEENSGRTIMIPNSLLFEKVIINYTSSNKYVLDQVSLTITFESNLEKTKEIVLEAARERTKDIIQDTGKDPYVRTYFKRNGLIVHIRYISPAPEMQKYSSEITQKIFKKIRETEDIKLAYPQRVLQGELK